MKLVKQWLQNNPREKNDKIELELLTIGINLYHVLSLIWDKTTRKHTPEFLIYKTQEIIEGFVNSLPDDVPIELVEDRVKNARIAISQDAEDIETIMMFFGAEIDNYPGSQYGLTLDFKIGILLHLLNLKGISDKQIFEKYQN